MGIMIYRDREAAGAAAATMIAAKIIEKPDAVVGICACSTAQPTYRQLISLTSAGILDWSEVTAVHTSELMKKTGTDSGVMSHYLSTHLYAAVKMAPGRVIAPKHDADDMEAACNAFEEKLIDCGGMDLLLLQLGRNGHVAFNGPAREFSAFTHVELLPQSTIEECAAMLPGEAGPNHTQAVTMGMSTLLSAKQIILCGFGRELSSLATRMLSSTITPAVPASMLQLHPNVTYMLDEDAAAEL